MVRLLECQRKVLEEDTIQFEAEELRLFGIALICSLLETFELDLTDGEMKEIERFAYDWSRT